jgi:molybdopterin synthase catalytic subunit
MNGKLSEPHGQDAHATATMKTRIEFTRSPIVPPAPGYTSSEVGACLEFSGIVRELENGKNISGLFYEAYAPMARAQLEKILAELAKKNPCDEVLFIHRLDFVPVGEASLFIRVCSRHRGQALALMGELVDLLKADVPIWKRAEK